jgi:ferrous iron transport protein B
MNPRTKFPDYIMKKTCALIGNPNVGKSVIFNKLTGSYAVVSNYPGTTVDLSRGMASFAGDEYQLIDTPGTLSLVPSSEDEQVTRDLVFRERPDVIVQVADAKNLRRTLLLTIELTELRIPMVLVLNMADEARERGIKIDRAELENILGISIIYAVGITGEGVKEIAKQIPKFHILLWDTTRISRTSSAGLKHCCRKIRCSKERLP